MRSFQVLVFASRMYSEGVATQSPGLPATAGYPGLASKFDVYPEGVAAFDIGPLTEPRWGTNIVWLVSQGSSLRSQPWAMRRNTFGVKTASFLDEEAATKLVAKHFGANHGHRA